jgi:ABC-type sugar transport system ATPase subunit
MPPITIQGLTKRYKDGPLAVDHVDLDIRDGEFMVLVGPSGCGKSTMLQMLAGIVEVSAGSIHIGDRDVTRLDPRKRDIAMVFQSYALYPHLSVRGNLGYGIKLRGAGKAEIDSLLMQGANGRFCMLLFRQPPEARLNGSPFSSRPF